MTATANPSQHAGLGRHTSDLTLAEAVPLAAALVSSAGARIGVRTLVIKGPTLAEHGLREPRDSNDVDVLVEPDGVEALARALSKYAWTERAVAFAGQSDAPHALTLFHREWPCDLDLHRFFPGFLADPSEVFDALWETRSRMKLGHIECAVPSVVASALIYQLSLLRGRESVENSELRQWSQSLNEHQRNELSTLIRTTGADLSLTGCREPWTPGLLRGHEGDDRSARRRRALSGDHGYYFWRIAYAEAPKRERGRAVFVIWRNGNRLGWRRAIRAASRLLRAPNKHT